MGFSALSLTGALINVGSFGIPFYGFSHVGIVASYGGRNRLFESTTFNTLPCLIQGKPVSGSQCQGLDARIRAFRGSVRRIPLLEPLNSDQKGQLTEYLVSNVGQPYDYLGAERSGGKLWAQMHRLLHPEDTASLFCSEWCALALRKIDVFRTKNVSAWNPNSLYRSLLRRGTYGRRQKLSY